MNSLILGFYYLFFLACFESMIWLDQSHIIIPFFVGFHAILIVIQFSDHYANGDGKTNLHPYKNRSRQFGFALKTVDTVVAFIVFVSFLFIINRNEPTPDLYKYLICFFCSLISGINIIHYHKKQKEQNINTAFSQDFGEV